MRKWFKKLLAVGLSAAVTIGLSACGGTDNNSGSGGNSGGRGNSSVNAQLAKEYVYKLDEFEIPEFVDSENGYINVRSAVYRDGKVYVLLEVTDWSKADNMAADLRLLVMNEDGSDLQVVQLETSGAEDGSSGEEAMPDQAAAVKPAEDDLLAAAAGEEVTNVWEYVSYSYINLSDDGNIFGIRNYYYEDYTNPEQYVSEDHQYVCCWGADGSLLWETELEGLNSDNEGEEWIYISNLVPKEDGGANLLLSGENIYRMSVSSDGEVSGKEKLSEEAAAVFNNYSYIAVQPDGTLLVLYSDENDWTKGFFVTYDLSTDTLGEPSAAPASLMWKGFGNLGAGLTSDLIFSYSDGVYSYNRGDESAVKKMDFVNSDVNISGFLSMVELSEQSFLGIFQENYDGKIRGAVFTYVDPAAIADKSVVVLAGNYIGSDLRQRVVEFNRSNDVYRIVLKEYDSYNSFDDYSAGYTQLNNDIITGSMPDILITDGLPVENYISKGLLADIGKLIEQDEELSQIEFMQNVFDAFSVDGKLYYIVPSFSVSTMIAKTSLVGEKNGWTMEEMQQVLAGMGEDTQAIGETTRSGFMSMAMSYCGNDFVDVATGKCSFNSDNFIAMMEFAKTLPEEIDWDKLYGEEDYWANYDSQYRMDRTLLMQLYIGSLRDLNYQLNGSFGEPVSYVGFPTESGKGSYINAYQSYVLSAKSANLEGAWSFVRYYLTDEYQEGIEWGLPVNKRVFMELAQEATQNPTYTDENGNEVEYDQTYWINNEEIALPPLTQEQVDQLTEFIMSVDRPYYYSADILNIVNEEMDAFYTGQKSAQDVANIIQSRAQIYVDENR